MKKLIWMVLGAFFMLSQACLAAETKAVPDAASVQALKQASTTAQDVSGNTVKSSSGTTTGAGQFTLTPVGLPNFENGTILFVDYNNDGYLDVVYSHTSTRFFRNIADPASPGKRIFQEDLVAGSNLKSEGGNIAFGDYDNDGDLDLAVTTSEPTIQVAAWKTSIYENKLNGQGNVTFTLKTSLTPMGQASLAWADYNNDGLLDLVVGGLVSMDVGAIKLYKNNGAASFVQVTTANFEPQSIFSVGSFVWGDYNNDGYLDLLYGAQVSSGVNFTKLYKNNAGDGTFTDVSALSSFPGLSANRGYAFGDVNNDGYLDILLSGCSASFCGPDDNTLTRVYKNQNGTGAFTDSGASLIRATDSTVAFGDYNNDGKSDILVVGASATSPWPTRAGIARIYQNTSVGEAITFADISALTANQGGMSWGGAVWGDYDNDGDLDVLVVGKVSSDPYVRQTSFYVNNQSGANTSPTAPMGLSKTVSGNDVIFSWFKSTDNQTPQNGLSYNLFIGTGTGLVDKMSPMARLDTGWRKVPVIGPINASPLAPDNRVSYKVKGVANTSTDWGVQAIDTGFKSSAFTTGVYNISGRVTKNGNPVVNTPIMADNVQVAVTNYYDGRYTFQKPPHWSASNVAPMKYGCSFTSKSYSNLTADQINQNYSCN